MLGESRVSARQGWMGEKTGLFENPVRCMVALVMALLMSLAGCQAGGGKILQGLPCSELEGQSIFQTGSLHSTDWPMLLQGSVMTS